ncbi:hypothetical protein PQX77_014100 [Marasmius sp. AFHP31]|nr:hypothetical protein PQX77_014100 [Marasmius sp. AFHP31]
MATPNRTYTEFIDKSAAFIKRHLRRGDILLNQIDSHDCREVTSQSEPMQYDAGSVIHGLSNVLLLNRDSQDALIVDLLRDVVLRSTSYERWHSGTDNVLLNDGGNIEQKAHLMRGYIEVYRANTTPADLNSELKSYISNQFNAVIGRATSGGSNIYSPQYNGPPITKFDDDSQVGAIAALMGSLAVVENNSPPAPRSPSTPVGAIVGGVIGGITLAGLIIIAIYYMRRRGVRARDQGRVTPWEASAHSLNIEKRRGSKPGPTPSPPPGNEAVVGQNTGSDNRLTSNTRGPIVAVTTEELVLALNQRLRDERRWDPNEIPPEYPQIEHNTLSRERCTFG